MNSQTIGLQDSTAVESDIETLAREMDMPVATVHEIYKIEHAKLDQIAKIKTYVPVLVRRRIKELLQSQRSAYEAGVSSRLSLSPTAMQSALGRKQ
jgi:hypothetical protein